MAITMSGATVDTSERDNLLASNVDGSIVNGGATANTQATGWFGFGGREATGAALAGVTESFAANVSAAIDKYKENIETQLNQLEAVESNAAFKGTAVSSALSKFVVSVREVGTNYINKLSSAEKQIIESVNAAYSTQDTDLSGNLNSDASSIQ